MSHNPTGTSSMADMRDVLDLLREYTIHFPELPIPYLSFSRHGMELELNVRLEAFEPWREALGMAANLVELYPVGGGTQSHLSVQSTVCMGVADGRRVEVPVQLYIGGLPFMQERPATPPLPQRQKEDPHDGPLHHDYATPHDMPAVTTLPEALR